MSAEYRPGSSSKSEGDVSTSTEMSITLSAETADCPFKASSVLLEPELSDVQIRVVDKHKVRE